MTKRQARSRLLAELKATYGPGYDVKIVKRRGRGRPKKVYALRGPLVLTLDEMMEICRHKGFTERQARRSAFADAKAELEKEDSDGHLLPEGSRRSLDMETIERYYRAGIEELRESEVWLAKEIDKIVAEHGWEAVPQFDPCGTGGVARRVYGAGNAPYLKNRKNNRLIDFL